MNIAHFDNSAKSPHLGQNTQQPLSQETECDQQDFQILVGEVGTALTKYCRKRPLVTTSLVFLAGLYTGWKIKPW